MGEEVIGVGVAVGVAVVGPQALAASIRINPRANKPKMDFFIFSSFNNILAGIFTMNRGHGVYVQRNRTHTSPPPPLIEKSPLQVRMILRISRDKGFINFPL